MKRVCLSLSPLSQRPVDRPVDERGGGVEGEDQRAGGAGDGQPGADWSTEGETDATGG